jgi:predicted  nucleic acid-binding Zn-ribbon protein
MSDLQVIQTMLESAARRRRFDRGQRSLWKGLLTGALLCLIWAIVYHLLPVPDYSMVLAGFLPLIGAMLGFVLGAWRRPGMAETARWLDQQRGLKERLSTALEVSSDDRAGSWSTLVVGDAAAQLKSIDPRNLLAFHLTRSARWATLVLVMIAGLGFVPEYRSASYQQKQADKENIAATGQQLAELTRRSLEKRAPALEPTEKALQHVDELGEALQKRIETRTEALKELANLSQKLQDELREMGKNPALRRMEQASRTRGGETGGGDQLQERLKKAQEELGKAASNPEKVDQLQEKLEQMREAAKGLAGAQGAEAEALKQKLQAGLEALSQEAMDAGISLSDLDDALAALEASKPEMMLKEMDQALKSLDGLREKLKELQKMQAQTQERGKDLAQQLERGQADSAQSTLKSMMRELKSGSVSPDQLKKMLEEVQKAVSPAKPYANTSEHLQQAAEQLQKGDKTGAAESLAKAAAELDELMQQLADAEQISEALQNMEMAGTCIGTGKGWGTCNKPGFGKGGRPGKGVGTWSDGTDEWSGENTGLWDNSGLERPDMEAKGLTDRGEGELSDALRPTKAKGQFTPGGQMPSITLKGVSIKGQSKISYQEAAAAAQTEAQSALSQEKVPRAYQGPVKDYFNDLDKQK